MVDAVLPGDNVAFADLPYSVTYDAVLVIAVAFRERFPGFPVVMWSGQGRNRIQGHVRRFLELERTIYVDKGEGCEDKILQFFKYSPIVLFHGPGGGTPLEL